MSALGYKQDDVSPVDNRPYTSKFHNFLWKQEKRKKIVMWHVTFDMSHVKFGRKRVLNGLNELKTNVFVEQPRLHLVC